MVLLLFFIYLVPVVFVFCIVLKLGLWLAINLIQLAVWLLKHAFVLLWKLLVFVAVLVFASLRSLSTAEIKPGSRRSNELHLTAKGSVAYGEGTSVFPLVKCYITLPKAQGVSPIKHSSTQKPSISFEAMKWMAFHITTHLT